MSETTKNKTVVDKAVEDMNPDETIAVLEWLTEKLGDDYLQCRTADEIVILIAGINCYGRGCDKFDLEYLIEYPECQLYPDCHTLEEFAGSYVKEMELVKSEVYDYFNFYEYGRYLKEVCRSQLQHVEYRVENEADDYYFDGYVEIYRQ